MNLMQIQTHNIRGNYYKYITYITSGSHPKYNILHFTDRNGKELT